MSRKPLKPHRRCIFCGGSGLNDEHIWPLWMHRYFTRKPHQQHDRILIKGRGQERRVIGPLDGYANAVNRTVRAVCRTCNEGWMGTIETNAISPLTKLMHRQPHLMLEGDQLKIVQWVALKMMVTEYEKPLVPLDAGEPIMASTTRESLRAFYEDRTLPPNLIIDAWSHDDEIWTAAIARQSLLISRPGYDEPAITDDAIVRNTQSLTFGVGYVIFQVFQSYAVLMPFIPPPEVSRRLWPLTGGAFLWPPPVMIGTEDANELSVFFDSWLSSPDPFVFI